MIQPEKAYALSKIQVGFNNDTIEMFQVHQDQLVALFKVIHELSLRISVLEHRLEEPHDD